MLSWKYIFQSSKEINTYKIYYYKKDAFNSVYVSVYIFAILPNVKRYKWPKHVENI
jgi:hypothetical protein